MSGCSTRIRELHAANYYAYGSRRMWKALLREGERGALPATGPYMFSSYDPKQGFKLIRNPHFREWSRAAQPSGYPDQIVLRFGGSADTHVSAVEHGKADLTSDAPAASADVLSALQTQYASQLEPNPQWTVHSFFLNTRVAPLTTSRHGKQ